MPKLNWIGEDAVAKPFRTLNDMSHGAYAMRFLHTDPQALGQQFNDDEAVWRAFESHRLIRRILGKPLPIPEECLKHADWLEAERTRPVRAIGISLCQ